MTLIYSMIAAMAQNHVIGVDNTMPWHLPDDFKRFKTLTMGNPVIMGRKTYESILEQLGKPLPGRTSIIVTRQGDYPSPEGVFTARSIEDAIRVAKDVAKKTDSNEVFCVGGAQLYEQFLQFSDRIYLTIIEKDFNGDAQFPKISRDDWDIEVTKTEVIEGSFSYRFETWNRQK